MTNTIQTRPVACNVCGSTNVKPLFGAIDRLHGFEGTFYYAKCRQCGLVYMNPQIVPEQLGRFYPDEYAPHLPKSGADAEKKGKLNLPVPIVKSLNAHSKILDVGCGRGTFLNRVKKQIGCYVYGVDISSNAVRCAKQQYGLEIFCGSLFDAPCPENTFDLITGWACLEHFEDPASVIKRMFSLCRLNGWILIKVPNYKSLSAFCFRDKWYPLDAPRHLYLFTPSTMLRLLVNSGFSDIHINYDTSSKGWRVSLQYLLFKDNYRPEIKNKIARSAIIKYLTSPIAYLSAMLKRSDIIIVTARKTHL